MQTGRKSSIPGPRHGGFAQWTSSQCLLGRLSWARSSRDLTVSGATYPQEQQPPCSKRSAHSMSLVQASPVDVSGCRSGAFGGAGGEESVSTDRAGAADELATACEAAAGVVVGSALRPAPQAASASARNRPACPCGAITTPPAGAGRRGGEARGRSRSFLRRRHHLQEEFRRNIRCFGARPQVSQWGKVRPDSRRWHRARWHRARWHRRRCRGRHRCRRRCRHR